MKISEKLAKEDGSRIWLYKQGVFWTAYEESALMLQEYKRLKINKKWVKELGKEIWNVGFPDRVLPVFEAVLGPLIIEQPKVGYFEMVPGFKVESDVLRLKYGFQGAPQYLNDKGLEDFCMWDNVIERLCAFRLADNTPMQAMVLVQQLQEFIFSLKESANGNLR